MFNKIKKEKQQNLKHLTIHENNKQNKNSKISKWEYTVIRHKVSLGDNFFKKPFYV